MTIEASEEYQNQAKGVDYFTDMVADLLATSHQHRHIKRENLAYADETEVAHIFTCTLKGLEDIRIFVPKLKEQLNGLLSSHDLIFEAQL